MTTVLVVDDSKLDRLLVGGLLHEEEGYRVIYAANGADALAHFDEAHPSVVVTDLQMPDMDGLELVRAVRRHHPEVPVVLITAHGSESLAIEALEQGAAGYVPKSRLSDRLVETVEQVVAAARAERTYEHLTACLKRAEFSFELANDDSLIDPLVDLVQQLVSGVGLCDGTERCRTGVALRHAVLNAMYRGNLEISAAQMQAGRESRMAG
jgi:DNA-binding NtrC family response regulator